MTDTIWQRLPRQPRGYTHNENVSFAMSFSSVDDAPQFLPLSASSSFFSVSVLFWMTSALQRHDNREARPGEPCALGRHAGGATEKKPLVQTVWGRAPRETTSRHRDVRLRNGVTKLSTKFS